MHAGQRCSLPPPPPPTPSSFLWKLPPSLFHIQLFLFSLFLFLWSRTNFRLIVIAPSRATSVAELWQFMPPVPWHLRRGFFSSCRFILCMLNNWMEYSLPLVLRRKHIQLYDRSPSIPMLIIISFSQLTGFSRLQLFLSCACGVWFWAEDCRIDELYLIVAFWVRRPAFYVFDHLVSFGHSGTISKTNLWLFVKIRILLKVCSLLLFFCSPVDDEIIAYLELPVLFFPPL